MKFRFLEEIATADVAFEAYGKTLDELFENCGLAVEETMVDTSTVAPAKNSKFEIRNSKLEDLLFDFLSELVFLKDRDGLLFSKIKVKLSTYLRSDSMPDKRLTLEAKLWGEEIDPTRHHLRADVKAVTKHLFKIEKEREGYKATVVLDI
ncbi:archease [Candidatus Gottesmanbacteria bacterium]|nr:archease [Candidatus Gottesmanbacteria bacterium]